MTFSRATDYKTVTRLLCEFQPPRIRRRLYSDDAFAARLGLESRDVLNLGGFVSIDHGTLFSFARQIFNDKEPRVVSDLRGRQFELRAGTNGAEFSSLPEDQDPWVIAFPELALLSPNGDERTRALDRLLEAFGPTAPDFETARIAASQRDLTNDEVRDLFSEKISGVAEVQQRIRRALERHEVSLSVLVPNDLSYYYRFAGPPPPNENPDTYIADTLVAHRQELLRRDISGGLQLCLWGALREDLSPGPWTQAITNDDLWEALSTVRDETNAFVLVSALDISTRRLSDSRYAALAGFLVAKLVSDTLPRPDGVDSYELVPLLAQLVLDKINTSEGGPSLPPFWKRMASWMHAGFLADAMRDYRFEWSSFHEWALDQLTPAGQYAMLLDLRREPMYRATEMSPQAFRNHVRRRLLDRKQHLEATGIVIPEDNKIDDLLRRADSSRAFLDWTAPGPLEGHRLPHRHIDEDAARSLVQRLGDGANAGFLSTLADFSQSFDVRGAMLEHGRRLVAEVALKGPAEDQNAVAGHLADACLAACVLRDTELAESIARTFAASAANLDSGQEVVRLFRALLLASTAFDDVAKWAAWLEEQLVRIAYLLQRGEHIQVFLSQLVQLREVVPARFCITARSEAIAIAAS